MAAKQVVIVRPAHEVEMFGGPDEVRVKVGSMVRVHPCHDLFMQGAKYAEVRRIDYNDGDPFFYVRPFVGGAPVPGKLRTLSARDVLVDEYGLLRS